MYKITVFTPTYNRGPFLERIFEVLSKESLESFEWIIVDDGSTDNTKSIVNKFIEISRFKIKYFYQSNSGKHSAINKGVEHAEGDLFFIVDSDDYPKKDTLNRIWQEWKKIKSDEYCGLAGLKVFPSDEIIGNTFPGNTLDTYLDTYRYQYKIKGDKAEVYRTDILRDYPFPVFDNENFISEMIVWVKIGSKYKMRWINEKFVVCEYMEEGLTANSYKLRLKNINGTLLTYETMYRYINNNRGKLRTGINYYRFKNAAKIKEGKLTNNLLKNSMYSTLVKLLYLKDTFI